VIVAQPDLVDVLLRAGYEQHLDGMWAVAPGWTVAIGRCAAEGDWAGAAEHQRSLTALREWFVRGSFDVFTVLMNARGIPGRFAPRPFPRLTGAQREQVLGDPAVQRLIREDPAATA